jgi:hypothetical protein
MGQAFGTTIGDGTGYPNPNLALATQKVLAPQQSFFVINP